MMDGSLSVRSFAYLFIMGFSETKIVYEQELKWIFSGSKKGLPRSLSPTYYELCTFFHFMQELPFCEV